MTTIRESTINEIKSGSAKILELCEDVTNSALVEPAMQNGWSVKDVLAHMAAWVWRCAAVLDYSHRTDGPLLATPDVAGLNREFYQDRKDWVWYEVRTDFAEAHRVLVSTIRQLPSDRLDDYLVQHAIAECTRYHYADHLPDLERWRREISVKERQFSLHRRNGQPHYSQVGAM